MGIAGTLAVTILVGVAVRVSMKQPIQQPGLIAVPLTSYPGEQAFPSFSPDGNQLAFCWDGPRQDNLDICVKLIGTDSLRRLTHDPAVERAPAWSPEGRNIAFLRRLPNEHEAVVMIPSFGGPPERKLTESRSVDWGKVVGGIAGLSLVSRWQVDRYERCWSR